MGNCVKSRNEGCLTLTWNINKITRQGHVIGLDRTAFKVIAVSTRGYLKQGTSDHIHNLRSLRLITNLPLVSSPPLRNMDQYTTVKQELMEIKTEEHSVETQLLCHYQDFKMELMDVSFVSGESGLASYQIKKLIEHTLQ